MVEEASTSENDPRILRRKRRNKASDEILTVSNRRSKFTKKDKTKDASSKEDIVELSDDTPIEANESSTFENAKDNEDIISRFDDDEKKWYELSRQRRESQLFTVLSTSWIEALHPQTSEEFLCNDKSMNSVKDWLESWKKRLEAKKEEAKNPKQRKFKKKRRKRDSSSSEEELDDADGEWCNEEREELANPLVIHGECGTGKTSLVHCLANQLGFEVVEWSTSERRNGKTLANKLTGLIESHNFSRRTEGANIMSMFAAISARSTSSPRKNTTVKKKKDFSLLLLDDADIIYAKDDGFWSTLKTFAEESKVPIVLTFTDFDAVTKALEQYEIGGYASERLNRCDARTATKFLRASIFGWLNTYLDDKSISEMLQKNDCDMRKTINQLQFCKLSSDHAAMPTLSSPPPSLIPGAHDSLLLQERKIDDNFRIRSKLESEFSILFDLPTKPITWRASKSQDLNFVPQFTLIEQEPFGVEDTSPLFDMLKEYIQPLRDLSLLKLSDSPVYQAVKDSRLRCVNEKRLYSFREVSLDYLPCLSTIHESFRDRVKQNSNQRRVQHPFDIVDHQKGTMIDATGRLKMSIVSYPFPKQDIMDDQESW